MLLLRKLPGDEMSNSKRLDLIFFCVEILFFPPAVCSKPGFLSGRKFSENSYIIGCTVSEDINL